MKKENIINLIKIIIFVLGFCGIAALLSVVLLPKTSEPGGGLSNPNARGFYGEPDNSIDVVVIGNSNAYSAFSPMVLWNKYGITSYDAAEGAQNIGESINIIKELFETQSPKLVIFDVDCLWQGKTKVDRIEGNIKSMIYGKVPMMRYHDRWKTVELADAFKTTEYTYRSKSRGQYLSKTVVACDDITVMEETDEVEPIPKSSMFFFNIFLNICKENGTEVMLVEMPTAKSWNYKKHNAMSQFADENDMKFVDMNLVTGKYAVDWTEDTRDGGKHLNCYGAQKVTKYLGKYLDENFDFENKKDDPDYSDWNKAYKKYKKYMKK